MLGIVVAVLLNAPAADTVQALPAGRRIDALVSLSPSPAALLPVSLEVSAGWTSVRQVDPYGRTGVTQFSSGGPLAGVRMRGDTWYAEFAGQLLHTQLADRTLSASVGRDAFRTGPLRWGVGIQAWEVRFRREDFSIGDVSVGTTRTAAIIMGNVGVGIGPYRGASLRVSALGGRYQNRYGGTIHLPAFSGDEPLADDMLPVIGGSLALDGITIGERIELGGSVRYLRLQGSHAPSVPDDEWSGTASVNVRFFGVRKKRLYVGAVVRWGPSGPPLITDRTFGLRGIWRLR